MSDAERESWWAEDILSTQEWWLISAVVVLIAGVLAGMWYLPTLPW